MPQNQIQTDFYVILPNGDRHALSLPFFHYYTELKLLRVSGKRSNIARVRRGIRAFPDSKTGGLRFESSNRQPIDVPSIPNVWARILAMAPFYSYERDEHDWWVYDHLTA